MLSQEAHLCRLNTRLKQWRDIAADCVYGECTSVVTVFLGLLYHHPTPRTVKLNTQLLKAIDRHDVDGLSPTAHVATHSYS